MAHVGQSIVVHNSSGHIEAPRRVTKVFGNGRIEISGKVGSWYEEEPGMYRNWNNPGFVPMVAIIKE